MAKSPTPKLKFIIDKKYDRQMIALVIKSGHQLIDFPKLLFEKIRRDEAGTYQEELRNFVEQQYKITTPYLTKTKILYQGSWDEINDRFFQSVAEIMEHPWKHESYQCVVSLFHPGISSWGGNKIVRWWKENPYSMRRITAHELIISHFFTLVREKFADENLDDQDIWKLAEIAAWALTGLEEKIKNLWPWDTQGYYTNHNYPNLVELQLKLKQPFLERENFAQYVAKGIQLL